jgi:electron transfer flavoprotein beta subunit
MTLDGLGRRQAATGKPRLGNPPAEMLSSQAMRIAVAIKQVPQTASVRMDEATGTMVREGVEAIVNPLDLYAIELALRLRDRFGGETVGISMGPPQARSALREAVAMGLDSAVLLSDKAFAGSDTWATGWVLAAAVRKLGPFDMLLCGERATDGDTGQVGPAVAAMLDWPVVTYVSRFDGCENGVARVHRMVENGYEVLDADLPAVLTVVKEVADPRLPTLRGKQKARRIEIPQLGPTDLGVEEGKVGLAGSPTRVVKIFRPRVARECEKIAAASDEQLARAAERLVEYLREGNLL